MINKPVYIIYGGIAMKEFDIPGLTYFQEKNIYSGSKNTIFNYKIWPGEKLKVTIWQGKKCLDKTPEQDLLDTQEFELSKEGIDNMIQWLETQSKEFFKTHKP